MFNASNHYARLALRGFRFDNEPEPAPAAPPAPTPTPPPTPAAPPAPAPAPVDPAEDKTDWKAEARKHEARAKENKAAADELAAIKESQKSDAEKQAEALAEAQKVAAESKSDALRARVALEKGLTPAQEKRLVGSTREELLADADQLLIDLGSSTAPVPKPDPSIGPKEPAKPVGLASAIQAHYESK